ncbi:sodium:solute symporter, partial [Schleiferiaceae bacterium]|nr:sodium:solute symporter [Schleiferiaceae bacterium]
LFLSLSYLGTDQSQVQRYLGAEDERSSKFGLLFNATFKVPMQFAILSIGVFLFVFYQFVKPPIFFNQSEIERAPLEIQNQLKSIEFEHALIWDNKREALIHADWKSAHRFNDQQEVLRADYMDLLDSNLKNFQNKDTDYVFITFILNNLPNGLIGLLLAVIICAAMSSTAGEVSALATTTYVDYYRVFFGHRNHDEKRTIRSLVLLWGIAAIFVALAAPLYENLIQLVNVLGSLFYGTILGIFLVGLFLKNVGGNQVFIGGVIAQTIIFTCHYLNSQEVISIGFLWYNVIATFIVITVSISLNTITNKGK